MVEESVEHAFDDLAARRWIENRLKAKAILTATQQGVEMCADELTDEYLEELRAAIKDLSDCMGPAPDEDADYVGDWQRLRSLVKLMDELTADLAEIQMEKLMEEMMKQKGLG